MNAMTQTSASIQDASADRRPGLLVREARADVLRLLRTPGALAPMLILPWGFYALFSVALASPDSGQASYALATFGVFACMGPCLFGLGAGIAQDRESGILLLKQVSPLPGGAFLLARLTTAVVFTLIVLAGLYTLAFAAAGVRLPPASWALMLAVHVAGVIPLCLIGLCVGLYTRSSAALALSNLLLFTLAVLGGLWVPLFVFPHVMQETAQAMPTMHLAALALLAIGQNAEPQGTNLWVHVAVLAGFTAVLGWIAWRRWALAGAR